MIVQHRTHKRKLPVHLACPESSHLSKNTRHCWIRFCTNRCVPAGLMQWGIMIRPGTCSEKEHFLQPLQAGNEVKNSVARCSLLALHIFLPVHLTQATHVETVRRGLSSKPQWETLPPFQWTKLQVSSEWSLPNEFPFLLPKGSLCPFLSEEIFQGFSEKYYKHSLFFSSTLFSLLILMQFLTCLLPQKIVTFPEGCVTLRRSRQWALTPSSPFITVKKPFCPVQLRYFPIIFKNKPSCRDFDTITH